MIIALASLAVILYLNGLNISKVAPMMPAPMVSTARNWAGYVVTSNFAHPQPVVEGVNGSWTVPSVTDIGIDSFSSCWVGVGGQYDDTLIQVGTEQDFTGGSPSYSAWYELLPADSVTIEIIRVSPGDHITASVTLVDPNLNVWTISIRDLTGGGSFQNNFTYDSRRLTAEWIVERPEINGALAPLANFGNATFTNCQAMISAKTGAITSFDYTYVTLDPELVSGSYLQPVDVSPTANKGTQFTVNYIAT